MGPGSRPRGFSGGAWWGVVWMVSGVFVAVPGFYAADALRAQAGGSVSTAASLNQPLETSAPEGIAAVPGETHSPGDREGLSAFAKANEQGAASDTRIAGAGGASSDGAIDWMSELLLTTYGSSGTIPEQERAQTKKLWPLVTMRYGGAGSHQRVYDAAVRILEVRPYYRALTPSAALNYLLNYNPADYGLTVRDRVAEIANVRVEEAGEAIYQNLHRLYSQSAAAASAEQQAQADAIAANRDAARARGQANNAAVHQYMVNQAEEQARWQATVRAKASQDRQKALIQTNRTPAVRVTPPVTIIPVR